MTAALPSRRLLEWIEFRPVSHLRDEIVDFQDHKQIGNNIVPIYLIDNPETFSDM